MATFYSLYFDIHENLVHGWNDLAFSLGKREKDVLIFSCQIVWMDRFAASVEWRKLVGFSKCAVMAACQNEM